MQYRNRNVVLKWRYYFVMYGSVSTSKNKYSEKKYVEESTFYSFYVNLYKFIFQQETYRNQTNTFTVNINFANVVLLGSSIFYSTF